MSHKISEFDLAQLRHLYTHLVNGTFSNTKDLAEGLLSPVIRSIERSKSSDGNA